MPAAITLRDLEYKDYTSEIKNKSTIYGLLLLALGAARTLAIFP
jgi:hypothetical protein